MSVTIIRKSSLEETVRPESVNDTQMLPDLLDQTIKDDFLCAEMGYLRITIDRLLGILNLNTYLKKENT